MWSSCHPKSDDDLKECAELGKSLNRLSQPTILTLLAQSETPLHRASRVCGGARGGVAARDLPLVTTRPGCATAE